MSNIERANNAYEKTDFTSYNTEGKQRLTREH